MHRRNIKVTITIHSIIFFSLHSLEATIFYKLFFSFDKNQAVRKKLPWKMVYAFETLQKSAIFDRLLWKNGIKSQRKLLVLSTIIMEKWAWTERAQVETKQKKRVQSRVASCRQSQLNVCGVNYIFISSFPMANHSTVIICSLTVGNDRLQSMMYYAHT